MIGVLFILFEYMSEREISFEVFRGQIIIPEEAHWDKIEGMSGFPDPYNEEFAIALYEGRIRLEGEKGDQHYVRTTVVPDAVLEISDQTPSEPYDPIQAYRRRHDIPEDSKDDPRGRALESPTLKALGDRIYEILTVSRGFRVFDVQVFQDNTGRLRAIIEFKPVDPNGKKGKRVMKIVDANSGEELADVVNISDFNLPKGDDKPRNRKRPTAGRRQ